MRLPISSNTTNSSNITMGDAMFFNNSLLEINTTILQNATEIPFNWTEYSSDDRKWSETTSKCQAHVGVNQGQVSSWSQILMLCMQRWVRVVVVVAVWGRSGKLACCGDKE